jgi:hypothetical protein
VVALCTRGFVHQPLKVMLDCDASRSPVNADDMGMFPGLDCVWVFRAIRHMH